MSALKTVQQENKPELILTWQLICHQCQSNFEVPVPFGPKEEKELKCPYCGSKDFARVEASNQGAPQCGG